MEEYGKGRGRWISVFVVQGKGAAGRVVIRWGGAAGRRGCLGSGTAIRRGRLIYWNGEQSDSWISREKGAHEVIGERRIKVHLTQTEIHYIETKKEDIVLWCGGQERVQVL